MKPVSLIGMKPRKPDRFERIADNRNGEHYSPEEVAHVLRAEHAWFRRMVKKVDAWACQELAEHDDVISTILDQLTQRRK